MVDSMSNFIIILNRIETVNFWLGIALSSILIPCIVFKTPRNVGNFKYLQLLFVLTDVAYSIAAYLLDEFFVCIYCTFFCAIILIVAVNFLFRLWAVKWPEKIYLFGELWFNGALTTATIFLLTLWFCSSYFLYAASPDARRELAPQFTEKYGLDAMTRAMIVGDYYRDGHYNLIPLLGLAIFTSIIGGVILFMGYASFSIVQYLRHSKIMSEKSRKMQIALFRMLACQTAVPVVLVHGCAGAQLFVPLTGINIQFDISTVFLSFFTPIDALIVILLIKNYRDAAFFLCRTSSKEEIHSTVSVISIKKK